MKLCVILHYESIVHNRLLTTAPLSPTGKITLSDLKRCRMAHLFYDTFINLEKYLDHEQRDPFTVQKVCVNGTDCAVLHWAMLQHTGTLGLHTECGTFRNSFP